MKTLSVIIVNYNTGDLLRKCLQSIKETTKNFENPSTEVIIIDNASRDESIKSIIPRLRSGQAGIKSIENKTNVGFAKAVNQGIQKSNGEYILLLNPDTAVNPNALKALINFGEKTPDAGVVGAQLLNPGGSIQSSVFHFPTVWQAVREFWLGQEGAYSKYTPKGNKPSRVDAVVGAAFLITPQARKKVGLLDERYFMYFEDLDYCRRIRETGLSVYYLPSAKVYHEHGGVTRTVGINARRWLVDSSKVYNGIVKHNLLTFILWLGQKWKKFFAG